jgi:rSAM/selenodomain-associated transferase 1
MSDDAVLIFAKAPQPGRVKTRLIPRLGEQGATQLYTALLKREVEWIAKDTPYAIELWTTPDSDHPLFLELAERYPVKIRPQCGADLGMRMGHAAQEALGRHSRVALLGVDCPVLNASHLDRTFRWLEEGMDAVLGPAEDGGYVLLGLKRWHPLLFQGHAWGGDDVAATTREALRQIGWQWRELPTLWDLDRPDDFARFLYLGYKGRGKNKLSQNTPN